MLNLKTVMMAIALQELEKYAQLIVSSLIPCVDHNTVANKVRSRICALLEIFI